MKRPDAKTAGKIDKLFAEALALHEQQRLDEAQQRYRKILALDNRHINALNLLGTIYLERGAAREAASLIQQSISLLPQQPAAWCNLGLCREKAGDVAGALTAYQRALQWQPDFPGVLYNRGALLRKQRRFAEALADYERALVLQPRFADAHNNRGNVLTDMGDLDTAIASFSQAIQLKPDYAEAYNNRGVCFWRLKRFAEALADYEQALHLKPDYFSAWLNRATVLYDAGQYAVAAEAVSRALDLQPGHGEALALQYEIAARCCDWRDSVAQVAAIARAVRQGEVLRPFTVMAAIDDPVLQAQAARQWAQAVCGADAGKPLLAPVRPGQHQRLRIAYLSADFHEHAVAYQMAGVFEWHDKQQFECYALSLGPSQSSPMRERLQKAFEHFVDVRLWSDASIVDYIQQQDIAILVDLAGYTRDGRPAVLARKPAPLQVNYLGYPGTLGMGAVDYIIADKQVIPETAYTCFQEKVILLPGSYLCHDPSRVIEAELPARTAVGLPASGFVFCCFNHHYKIIASWFAIWMRLLARVEGSVLWLSAHNELAIEHLQQAATACGVDPARLVFAPRTADPLQHLSRLRHADLFLDTLPYNAHATACDALWAGVPLLTCTGHSFPARVATSLLMAMDLPELVTDSPAAYEAAALALATQPGRLLAIREKIAAHTPDTSLFDAEASARKLERAYHAIWVRYLNGLPPDHLDVS